MVAAHRNQVFGIEFTRLGTAEIATRIASETPSAGEPLRLLVTANLDHIVALTTNAEFREAYDTAWLATIDGAPVFLYARWRGVEIKERVTGADLFPQILERLVPGRHRPFVVCSQQDTASALGRQFTALGFVDAAAVVPPRGFETDPAYSAMLIAAIRAHATTHLFFGVGAPKSEIWMHRHRQELRKCYGFAFGAGLDFHAGTKRRAPQFMRRLGLEWVWRVASEPRRLARRYFINSWTFLRAIQLDLLRD